MLEYYNKYVNNELDPENALGMAEKSSLNLIVAKLETSYPTVPIIAHSTASTLNAKERRQSFFCVSPLDGSMDFVRQNSTGFGIAIGFCAFGMPVFGVIGKPAEDVNRIYFSVAGEGAFIEDGDGVQSPLIPEDREFKPGHILMLSSFTKKYLDRETSLCDSANIERLRSPAGINLRFLMIAQGKADVYPQLAPTSEWETCAGHAIVTASKGRVFSLNSEYEESSIEFFYNKIYPLNPAYIVYSARHKKDDAIEGSNGVCISEDTREDAFLDSVAAVDAPHIEAQKSNYLVILSLLFVVPVLSSCVVYHYFMGLS